MTTKQYILNQFWEMKYEMLQALAGLTSDEINSRGDCNHWPIGWIVSHCMIVLDNVINRHISGSYSYEHDENISKWPLVVPTKNRHFQDSLVFQEKWLNLINMTINNLTSISDADLQNTSSTGVDNEPLVESCLRAINHANAHLRNIWCFVGQMKIKTKWPEQGIWMPKTEVLSSLRKEMSAGLKKVGDSQSPFIRKLAQKYFPSISHHDKWTVIQICEDLMESRNGWAQMIAHSWIQRIHDRLEMNDFFHFERWLYLYIRGWGSCDDFCKRVVNPLLEKYPKLFSQLKKWTGYESIWFRRAAAVSLIKSEKNRYVSDFDIKKTFTIVNLLLKDKEKYVQKGMGWLLKASSIYYQDDVVKYLIRRKDDIPRLSYRYALENMPIEIKRKLMS